MKFQIREWAALMPRDELLEYVGGASALEAIVRETGLAPLVDEGRTVRWWREDVDGALARMRAARGATRAATTGEGKP